MPVFIYVCMSVCVCVCMHAALSDCVNACVRMHVSFESIGVRVSYMCLHVVNLSGPRLPEAGFSYKIQLQITNTAYKIQIDTRSIPPRVSYFPVLK